MRSRAYQVARIRLVDTEEGVETHRPVLDASKTTIGQAELVVDEDDGLRVSVNWSDTPRLVRG